MDTSKTAKARAYFRDHPDAPTSDAVTLFGCAKRTARRAKFNVTGKVQPQNSNGVDSLSDEYDGPDRTIVSRSIDIRTLDQLLKYCRVDLDEWEVVKHTINMWGSEANPNFQVKAWLTLIGQDELSIQELVAEFRESAEQHAPKYKKVKHEPNESGNAAEISIHDLHFGSLCWKPETGHNYDIKIAQRVFGSAIDSLINDIVPYKPERILMPVGSDFFNVNSKLNETVHGTLQDEDCRWQKTFIYGRRMVVKAVDLLRQIAPVDVYIIGGNHDEERAYYLGDSLWCWYRNCEDVNVENTPTPRKYWQWGSCLVGITHGQAEVKGTLPLLMATESPMMFARAKFREWHTGHLHHRAVKSYDYGTEANGIRERILPSLATTDSWHKKKGYGGLREAEAFIWNRDQGNIATFKYHP